MNPFINKFSIILLHSVLMFNLNILGTCIRNYCEDMRNQASSSSSPSLLNSMTLCRSNKLYLRTSLGLFEVTSVDYTKKTLTVSHSSSSSSSLQFVSPLDVTSGFPSPPESNSLLLFNCSSKRRRNGIPISSLVQNSRGILCSSSSSMIDSDHEEKEKRGDCECLVVNDSEKMEKGFHPEHLNCSNYIWVHRDYSSESSDVDNKVEGYYKVGTRISFDIPDHVPDLCKECEKPNGNCGAGLKCLCHANECSKFIYLFFILFWKNILFNLCVCPKIMIQSLNIENIFLSKHLN